MKTATAIASAILLTLCALGASAETQQEQMNKKIVLDFYDKAINQKDFAAASRYLADDTYIQHNPLAADGPEGLKAFLEYAKKSLPNFHVDFKRVLADGDFVMVHAHTRVNPDDPNDRGSAVMDIFRVKDGKVVEHWDVSQPIPEKSNNDNGMF